MSKVDKEPVSCNLEDVSAEIVHVVTIRCLSSVPDELLDMLAEVEKQDMQEANL